MVQGYAPSNSSGTCRRSSGSRVKFSNGGSLFSCSGKKNGYGIRFFKNNDRHPYDERYAYTATQLDLPEFEKSDIKTGGFLPNN